MDELPEGFDLDALLAPIAEDAAAGTDLREDASPQSLYYRLRDARAEARAAERAMESDDEAARRRREWRTIRQLGIEAIAQNSKDLEVASWLTEALLRCDGLAGFIAGVRLMHGLVEHSGTIYFRCRMQTASPPAWARWRGSTASRATARSASRCAGCRCSCGRTVPMAAVAVRAIRKSGHHRRSGKPPEAHRGRRHAVRDRRKRGASRGRGAFRSIGGGGQYGRRGVAHPGRRARRARRRGRAADQQGARLLESLSRPCGRFAPGGAETLWPTRRAVPTGGGAASPPRAAARHAATWRRARTRCAASPRSPSSSVAPSRCRRSPTRCRKRCGAPV